VKQAIITW